jgi:hypothetical protein
MPHEDYFAAATDLSLDSKPPPYTVLGGGRRREC